MIKLLICTPVHSEMKVPYVKSLINTIQDAQKYHVTIDTYFPMGSAIHQQRNFALAKFLKDPTLTHLLFIDSDILFSSQDVFKLISHDKDFSGVAYRAKGASHIAFNVTQKEVKGKCEQTGMIKVDGFGGGFLMIKRAVIEKMVAAYPELKCLGFPPLSYDQEELNKFYFNLFDWTVNERTNYILSEDFTFCHRWRKIGGEIFIDTNIQLGHVGDYVYAGKLADNIVDGQIVVRRLT